MQVLDFLNLAQNANVKGPFRSILQKFQRAVILRSLRQISSNFYQTLFLILPFKMMY